MANNTLFTLRYGNQQDSGDFVLESENISIDLWAEYGSPEDEFWQDWADSMKCDYSEIVKTAGQISSDILNELGLDPENPSAQTMIKVYIVYMLTMAITAYKPTYDEWCRKLEEETK